MKKEIHAIYKGPIGLYSWEYIPCKKKAKDFLFYPYTTEEDYPLIVNRVGGKTSFDINDPNFVGLRVVEEGKNPLTREERYPKIMMNLNMDGLIKMETLMLAHMKDIMMQQKLFVKNYFLMKYIIQNVFWKSRTGLKLLNFQGLLKDY